MPIEEALPFDLNDLHLDVRLEALVDGEAYDFTGRRHFTAGFFRESIGFGITNIKVEVNTSLQPIVEITFIDLYGNTMFGGQYNDRNVDYSSFFRWPPPKFVLTFKGYLGRPVTWTLNLKQYDINFISNSGHYELKASFVPNQWGFFSDIPFKFLLAVKRLKLNKGQEQQEIMSVYDLIKIGKRVQKKKIETTGKFDLLRKKLSSITSNKLGDSIANTKIISFGERITGEVDGKKILGFEEISFMDIISSENKTKYGITDITSLSIMLAGDKTVGSASTSLDVVNSFLFTKILVGGKPLPNSDMSFDRFKSLTLDAQQEAKLKCLAVVQNNIKKIDDQIGAELYNATSEELRKITISEVLRQIAKDTAYIMGRILEAGFRGSLNSNRGDLKIIGQHYPLIEKDGKELPATTENSAGVDYGARAPGCEMSFVTEFKDALIDGVANDTSQEDISSALAEDKLVKRISNLEALGKNPYLPFYDTIVSNILIRSGIAAFQIRSDDPNRPGDYDEWVGLDSEVSNAGKLAKKDVENISETLLRQLSDDDKMSLVNFVDFFDKLLSDDGDSFLNSEGKEAEVSFVPIGFPITNEIWNYKVVMNYPDGKTPKDFDTQDKIAAPNIERSNYKTVADVMIPLLSGVLKDQVDPSTMVSYTVVNNGLIYSNPSNYAGPVFMAYNPDEARKLDGVNTADTDSELNGADEDKDDSTPVGIVKVDKYYTGEDGLLDSEVFYRVTGFNSKVELGMVLDYSKCRIDSGSITLDPDPNLRNGNLLWTKKIVPGDAGDNEISAKDGMAYTVLYLPNGTSVSDKAMFGLFADNECGEAQRAYVKSMCSEIRRKFVEIDRAEQSAISNLLGKVGNTEEVLYKQFHSLFHQWSSMAYKDSDKSMGSSLTENLANEMEALYGGNDKHISIGGSKGTAVDNVMELPDVCFIYDFPLQRIREMQEGSEIAALDVKNSIISLDPLHKVDANTTVLNAIYNICSKNNFMFLPIPGYAGYLSVKEVYKPFNGYSEPRVSNFFHVMFMPTPESRSLISNKANIGPISSFQSLDEQRNIKGDAIAVKFGATDNQIFRNVSVNTRENKVTAESIAMLQDMVDKEDHNKEITMDCSMLNIMGGRSYTAKVDMLGNSQVYPMQFFFLEKMPLFDGLYQIMKVEHTITPNDMQTSIEGMRMRFNPGSSYFSVPPITLETYAELSSQMTVANVEESQKQPEEEEKNDGQSSDTVRGSSNINASSDEVILLPNMQQAQRSDIFKKMSGGPIVDNHGPNGMIADRKGIIQNVNTFIIDIIEPFAQYLKQNDPALFKKWTITSVARKWSDGKTTSQHLRGQAFDSSIPFANEADGLIENHKLLNHIMDFYDQNPSLEYGQILMETRARKGKKSVWIHWSYRKGDNQKERKRFVNDDVCDAPMNTGRGGPQLTSRMSLTEARMQNLLG